MNVSMRGSAMLLVLLIHPDVKGCETILHISCDYHKVSHQCLEMDVVMFQYSKQPQLDGIVAFAGKRRSYHCFVRETSAKVY